MTSTSDDQKLFSAKTALILGATLLAGFAAIATSASVDRRQRSQLERLDQPTAAGDPVTYTLPTTPPDSGKPEPVLLFKGAPLYASEKESLSDASMLKTAMDDAGKIQLYRCDKRKKQHEIYLKLAPGEFLELAPEPPAAAR